MMDGPVLGRFSVVLGTVRHKFREKHVGRCVEALWQTGHGISAVEISPLDILGRYDASGGHGGKLLTIQSAEKQDFC